MTTRHQSWVTIRTVSFSPPLALWIPSRLRWKPQWVSVLGDARSKEWCLLTLLLAAGSWSSSALGSRAKVWRVSWEKLRASFFRGGEHPLGRWPLEVASAVRIDRDLFSSLLYIIWYSSLKEIIVYYGNLTSSYSFKLQYHFIAVHSVRQKLLTTNFLKPSVLVDGENSSYSSCCPHHRVYIARVMQSLPMSGTWVW